MLIVSESVAFVDFSSLCALCSLPLKFMVVNLLLVLLMVLSDSMMCELRKCKPLACFTCLILKLDWSLFLGT